MMIGLHFIVLQHLLPARRYASEGISRHRVSVSHTPVLRQNG